MDSFLSSDGKKKIIKEVDWDKYKQIITNFVKF
jgi:hypothetical protein